MILNKKIGVKDNYNRYIYNIYNNSDKNINITEILPNSKYNLKIEIGVIGTNNFNIIIPTADINNIKNINLLLKPTNNYIYIDSGLNTDFEIIIEDNIFLLLKNTELKIISNPLNILYLNLKEGKYFIYAYINDSNNYNYYAIKIKNIIIDKYFKKDNFYNFLGNIEIIEDKIYLLEILMKSNININSIIILSNNEIQYLENYKYKPNDIIINNNNNINALYVELKFQNFDNNTILYLHNDINIKFIDNLLYINNIYIKNYNRDNYLKLFIKKVNNIITTYYYYDWGIKNVFIKLNEIITENNLYYYSKLTYITYKDNPYENIKLIVNKPFIFFNKNNYKYIDNININLFDNINKVNIINEYKYELIMGGNIHTIYNDKFENFNIRNNVKKNIFNFIINKKYMDPVNLNSQDSNFRIIGNGIDISTNSIKNIIDYTTTSLVKVIVIIIFIFAIIGIIYNGCKSVKKLIGKVLIVLIPLIFFKWFIFMKKKKEKQ